jgi:hypothetical protein
MIDQLNSVDSTPRTYNVAHIKNGIVDNICVWESIPKDGDYPGIHEFVDVTDTIVGIGWEYADGVFVNPNDLTQTYTVPTV